MECVFAPVSTIALKLNAQELLAVPDSVTSFPPGAAVEPVLELLPGAAPTLLAGLLCAVAISNTMFPQALAAELAELLSITVAAMFAVFVVHACVVRFTLCPRDLAVDSALVRPLPLVQDVLALVSLALPTRSASSHMETAVEDVPTALPLVVSMQAALACAALLASVIESSLVTAVELALVLPMLLVSELNAQESLVVVATASPLLQDSAVDTAVACVTTTRS